MISVVVPLHRANTELYAQLQSLECQDVDFDWELVLSCNSLPALDRLRHADLPIHPRCALQIVDATHEIGPSYARNAGWRSSTYPVVLFCDSDDVASPGWLAAMQRLSRSYDVFGGPLEYAKLNDPDPSAWNHQWGHGAPVKFGHLPFLPSCNVGFRRQALEGVEGWDEGLSASEDTDICWRVQYGGGVIGYSDAAVMHYRLRGSIWRTVKQNFHYGVSDAYLMKRHCKRGARRPLRSGMRDIAGTLYVVGLALASKDKRQQAAAKAGNLMGRVVGSARCLVWVI